jgi:hypothetical protein
MPMNARVATAAKAPRIHMPQELARSMPDVSHGRAAKRRLVCIDGQRAVFQRNMVGSHDSARQPPKPSVTNPPFGAERFSIACARRTGRFRTLPGHSRDRSQGERAN